MEEIIEKLYEKFVGMGLGTHIPNGNSGGMWPEECKRLLWAELNSPNLTSLVIGSHQGSSELLLGIAKDYKNDKSPIISVDLCFGDYYDLNMKRLISKYPDTKIIKWEMNSSDFSECYKKQIEVLHLNNKTLGLVLYDGFHSMKQTLIDWGQTFPYYTKGTIGCFHDCGPNFPKRGSHELPIENIGKEEDFLMDESISLILNKYPEISEIDLKLGFSCYHPMETGLEHWVRGTTSPYNSLFFVQHD